MIPAADPANYIWACGSDGTPCKNPFNGEIAGFLGPNEAFFRLIVDINPLATLIASSVSMLADDYMELYVNGAFVTSLLLEDQPPDQQKPVEVPLAAFLDPGRNVLAIHAFHGELLGSASSCFDLGLVDFVLVQTHRGPFCESDRAFEYAYVSGSVTQQIPEPSTLALVALAGCAMACARRKASSSIGGSLA